MAGEINKLKNLSPKDRIKKLKELQEKDKKEIQEAQKLLKEAEEESDKEDKLREIPIPQVEAVNIDELFSQEAKELFKAKRFASDKKEIVEEKEDKKVGLESIADTAPKLNMQEEQAHIEYARQLSEKPADLLYSRTKEIYSDFKDKGYLSQNQQQELSDIGYANQKKFEAIESGRYKEASQKVAEEMSLIEKMKGVMYKR